MSKKLLITEKTSVAMEFAKALKITAPRKNGYIESNEWIITWCVGHLVTMSYPEKYDEKLKFIGNFHEVEPNVAVRQMNASFFTVGLLFERFLCKREFQTDLSQAFIVLHDCELDFFSSDPLRLTFASQKLVFTETSF